MEDVRLTIEIDADLKYQYRLKCMCEGKDMKTDITNYIKKKLKK